MNRRNLVLIISAVMLFSSCAAQQENADIISASSKDSVEETQSIVTVAESEDNAPEQDDSPSEINETVCYAYPYYVLDSAKQELYRSMYAAVADMSDELEFRAGSAPTLEDVKYIYQLLHNDEPMFFNTSGHFSYKEYPDGTIRVIAFTYLYDKQTYLSRAAEIDTAMDEILSAVDDNASDAEKVKYFHDSLIKNCAYERGENCNNIYGAFVEHKAMCQGYSKAFSLLCSKAGINSLTVLGSTGDTEHMWNKVCLDGDYYNVDVTWDDPEDESYPDYVKYEFFCLDDESLSDQHTEDGNYYPIPAAKGRKYYYYSYNDLIADSYDSAKELILRCIDNDSSDDDKICVQLQASDETVYDELVTKLFGADKGIGELTRIISDAGTDIDTSHIDYIINNNRHTIKIFLNRKKA